MYKLFPFQHFQYETSFCKNAKEHQGYLFAPISTIHGGVHTYVGALGSVKVENKHDALLYIRKIYATAKMLRDIW